MDWATRFLCLVCVVPPPPLCTAVLSTCCLMHVLALQKIGVKGVKKKKNNPKAFSLFPQPVLFICLNCKLLCSFTFNLFTFGFVLC